MKALVLLVAVTLQAQTVKSVCASGCDYSVLQTAVNAATAGWILELKAGETFSVSGGLILPDKSITAWPGVIIRSSGVPNLTPDKRVTPDDAANLATITCSTWSDYYTVHNDPGAAFYRFQGIKFTAPANFVGDLIEFGTRTPVHNNEGTNQISGFAHDIVFDQCYFAGGTSSARRGIRANMGRLTVTNSWFQDLHSPSYEDAGTVVESNAIGGWSGPGPFYFRNNHLEAAGITTLFGGATPSISGLRADGLWFIGNHYYRSWKYRTRYHDSDPEGTCLYDSQGGEWYKNINGGYWNGTGAGVKYWHCVAGTWTEVTSGEFSEHYVQKNIFELKNAWRTWVEGNYLENSWQPADYNQYGAMFLFNLVDNDPGSGVYEAAATVGHVKISNNYGRRAPQLFSLGTVGSGYYLMWNNITVENNLFDEIGDPGWTLTYPEQWGTRSGSTLFWVPGGSINMRYLHNTVNAPNWFDPTYGFNAAAMLAGEGDFVKGFSTSIVGNILPWGTDGFRSDGGAGALSLAVQATLDDARSVSRNVVVNDKSQTIYGRPSPEVNLTYNVYDGNTNDVGCRSCGIPATWADVGFEDYNNSDYRLDAASAYTNGWAHGRDAGADVTAVTNSTSAVVAGTYNPYLDFQVRSLVPASTSLAFRYTAYDTAACTVAVSDKWDMSSPTSETDAGGALDRTTSITSLAANTRYWWTLTCGAYVRKGITLTTP